jgi:hypothetical protein
MKKNSLLLLLFLFSIIGYSQDPLQKIKTYLNENRSKIQVQANDISDLVIVNDFSSESTGINNYHVKQRYQGIEIYNSDSNFWIKDDKVINGGDEFINNISQKVNTATPTISVTNAFSQVLSKLKENVFTTQIIEAQSNNYKLTNGVLTDDPIKAKLNFILTGVNTLRLAWSFEFYSQDTNHLWSIDIDAVDGKIITKRDLVISCNFNSNNCNHKHNNNSKEISFNNQMFKNKETFLAVNPGNTAYRVIPFNFESPNHTSRQLITNPEFVTNASPKGWHDSNTISGTTASLRYSITRGNNVWARNDFAGTNTTSSTNGTSPTGTGTFPNLTFDFPYPGNSVVASTYVNAANTNLFYMNNIMHDLWYQYGFNEANKNFQANNYGRGGSQGDFVIAEAQDGSQASPPNLNNANFATPTDGSSPRMQMYLWDVGPSFFIVNSPADIAGGKEARDNSFNPGNVAIPLSPNGIVADLVLVNDGDGDVLDACQPITNAAELSGKIAVIKRGDCTFIFKVKAAQSAGAIAAIIVNNVDGIIGMSGADNTITIPAISVSKEVGDAIIARMATSTVNVKLERSSAFVNTDGDLDNGIIAHEFGHGISTRLSGNCLNSAEQQGEGWSDWFWLMMQIKPGDTRNDARGIGTFAQNESIDGLGIREFRYSTDMAVNPHTFAKTNVQFFTDDNGIDVTSVHGMGSIWAVMLWDLAWNYIDKYGYDPNIYTGTGGNNKVMRLVLDGIKLDGCNPTFVSARDALIAADQATTGGADYCMIWRTFARRGLGVNADSGSASSSQDQIEDFTEPTPGPNCVLSVNYFENNELFRIYPNPTNGLLNVRINNYIGKVNIQIVDINGRIVSEFKNEDFNTEKSLNLNNLQAGMYVLKVSGDSINYTQKIIKK